MAWPKINSGKHAKSSLPTIVLRDPDWVFWAATEGLLERLERSGEVVEKARSIRIPDGKRGPRVADYIANARGVLDHVEIGYASEMIRDEDRGVRRLKHFDLFYAYRLKGAMDKTGSGAILALVRRHVFKPRGWTRMTVDLCESFFDDDANFDV
jgi:hypothetical protein